MLEDLQYAVHSEMLVMLVQIMRSLVTIALANHFICCGWYAVSTYTMEEGLPSWRDVLEREDRDLGYRYVTALHWSLTQFTPASMEIFPRNYLERIYAISVVFIALVVFSAFVSSITTSMANMTRISQERARQHKALRHFISENRISIELSNRVSAFARQHHFRAQKLVHEGEIQILKVVPETMRLQLHWEVYQPRWKQHPFFAHVGMCDEIGLLTILHNCCKQIHLDVHDQLFSHESECREMYAVLQGIGEFTLWHEDSPPTSTRPGSFICEPVLWVKWTHLGRFLAVSPMEFVALEAGRLRMIASHRPDVLEPARKYAKMYWEYLEEVGDAHPSDVFWDFDRCQEFAQLAFTESELAATDNGATIGNRSSTSSKLMCCGFRRRSTLAQQRVAARSAATTNLDLDARTEESHVRELAS